LISEFIKNLDVTFEIVSPEKPIEFEVSKPVVSEIAEIKVIDATEVKEEQVTFSFDLPISKPVEEVDENKILFELSNETKNIEVNQAVQMVPMTELNENGIIKYSLEEYMELENELLNSKPVENIAAEPVEEELNITMKKVDEVSNFSPAFEDVSPMEMSIEETLRVRADERRRKLKDFNYKFHNNPSRMEEFEKEPAYKRLGIDINTNPQENNTSRTSLGTDSNDDIQLRSNNSFLHDNVD
jgi:cell division protein FtsZ